MENGLVISLRFGQGCTIGNLRIEPIEPIAGFKISEQESIEEFYLPVLSLSQSIPFNTDCEWFVFKPMFYQVLPELLKIGKLQFIGLEWC